MDPAGALIPSTRYHPAWEAHPLPRLRMLTHAGALLRGCNSRIVRRAASTIRCLSDCSADGATPAPSSLGFNMIIILILSETGTMSILISPPVAIWYNMTRF